MIFYRREKSIGTDFFRNHDKYWSRNIKPTEKDMPEKSISVVTRCMNRLHDLKITLPKNIEDNSDYSNVEFVVLDYNSTDGLGEWIKVNMYKHIESGRLVYFRTNEPDNFKPNHSQNVVFRCASGELVANVDSDNFTQKGYVRRLNQCTLTNERLLIVPANFLLPGSSRLFLKGRFCTYKKDIEFLRGFDEDLDEGFGNDDLNFALRAMLAGFTIVRYESHFTKDRLPTSNEERVLLVKNKNYHEIRNQNAQITEDKLNRGTVSVNKNIHWGRAKLVKNFVEEVQV